MASKGRTFAVHPGRIRVVKEGKPVGGGEVGPVVYWMFRDQRWRDNWALIHAVDQANLRNVPVAVAFNLFDRFLGSRARLLGVHVERVEAVGPGDRGEVEDPLLLVPGTKECGMTSFMSQYKIGRVPNGYVSCMSSICGVHDQGWCERPIFGKIWHVNYAGCKRKFDVGGYISYVKRLVCETKKRKAESTLLDRKEKKPRD